MSVVISVEQVSKLYRLGAIGAGTLRGDFERWWARMRGRPDPLALVDHDGNGHVKDGIVWALRDVSFEVKEGEVLGIIGRNGAGKSTLLKILSQVTAPTAGCVKIRGRVASLLEVGTGFHPELTGRENIYLNGAILGMKRSEIDRKFDEIVDFSGVEQFIDTPVKRYSSGMYVRLAFAVAAHLEPEILLVDEVLAVGDAAFQKKCLGKMSEVSGRHGRTVLFVSHNMASINQLCAKSIWFNDGMIRRIDRTSEIVSEYVRSMDASGGTASGEFEEDVRKEAQLLRVRMLNRKELVTQRFACDDPVIIEFLFRIRKALPAMYAYLEIRKCDGTTVLVSDSFDTPPNALGNLPVGTHTVTITIPQRTLGPGDYTVYLNFTSGTGDNYNVDSPGDICSFSLDDLTTRRGNSRGGLLSTLPIWSAKLACADEPLVAGSDGRHRES